METTKSDIIKKFPLLTDVQTRIHLNVDLLPRKPFSSLIAAIIGQKIRFTQVRRTNRTNI